MDRNLLTLTLEKDKMPVVLPTYPSRASHEKPCGLMGTWIYSPKKLSQRANDSHRAEDVAADTRLAKPTGSIQIRPANTPASGQCGPAESTVDSAVCDIIFPP